MSTHYSGTRPMVFCADVSWTIDLYKSDCAEPVSDCRPYFLSIDELPMIQLRERELVRPVVGGYGASSIHRKLSAMDHKQRTGDFRDGDSPLAFEAGEERFMASSYPGESAVDLVWIEGARK